MLAYTWNCAGSNGGTTAQCYSPEGVQIITPVQGVCGSANGTTATVAPTTNLCSAGTASVVIGDGPWLWVCEGQNGGQDADCSSTVQSATAGCGSSSGTCLTGTPGNVTGTTWACTGSDGTAVQCSTQASGANGVCGSANATMVSSAPTSNLCADGSTPTVSSSTGDYTFCGGSNGGAACQWMIYGLHYTWTCPGSNGGTNAQCVAGASSTTAVNGACGSANGIVATTSPSSASLCSVGTASTVVSMINNTLCIANECNVPYFTWTCAGSNGGTTAQCESAKTETVQ